MAVDLKSEGQALNPGWVIWGGLINHFRPSFPPYK